MIKLIKQNSLFFAGSFLIILIGSILLFAEGNPASFILLTDYHSGWLNIFFINYTFLGNGIFAIILSALYIFVFKRRRVGLAIICSFLLSGLIAQVIKHIVNFPRPKSFFGNSEQQHFISGIEFAYNNSFPSGHTATAFAIATVIVLTMKNKKWQIPVLLVAFLVGFSRIYLGQHFLLDVVAGAFVGTLSGVVSVYILQKNKFKKNSTDIFLSSELNNPEFHKL